MRMIVGLSAAALIFCCHVSASVILSDNLAQPSGGGNTFSDARYLAISFETDNSAYLLDTVTLLLSQDPGTTGVEVQLFSDAQGPGTVIATLNGPSTVPTSLTDENYTDPGLLLSANTIYWIVAQTSSGTAYWSYPTNSIGTGVGFLGVWAYYEPPPYFWLVLPPMDQAFQAEVTADAVPEPSTLALFSGCFLVAGPFIVLRRRAGRAS